MQQVKISLSLKYLKFCKVGVRLFMTDFSQPILELSNYFNLMIIGHILSVFVSDGAFKKLKTEGETGGGMSVHHAPSSSCPTPARRRHRTTFTQVRQQIRYSF